MKNNQGSKIWKVALFIGFAICLILKTEAQVSVQQVIATELAFAKMAVDQDTRAAFLAYMSEHSLLERQGKLVKGRSVYLNLPSDTSGKLIWFPTIATISASGDLGYTSGPYTYEVKGMAVAYGNFATVWEKQADNQWKFVIDLGNSHDPVNAASSTPDVEKINPSVLKPDENLKNDLMQVEQELNTQLQQGLPQVYLKKLHPSARILRTGKPPYITTAEKTALFAQKASMQFIPEGSRIANSNDLGVVYGSCRYSDLTYPNKVQSGVYMHVWRKDAQKGWQLLHESINTVADK